MIPQVLVYFPFCPIKELPKAIILCFFTTPNLCPYSSSMPSSVSCDITTCRARKSLQVRAPLLGSSFEHQGVEKVHTISHSCWGQPGLVPRGWALPGTPGSLHQEPHGKCFSTCPPLPFQGLLPGRRSALWSFPDVVDDATKKRGFFTLGRKKLFLVLC